MKKIVLYLVLVCLVICPAAYASPDDAMEHAAIASAMQEYIVGCMDGLIAKTSNGDKLSPVEAQLLAQFYVTYASLQNVFALAMDEIVGETISDRTDTTMSTSGLLSDAVVNFANQYARGGAWEDTMAKAVNMIDAQLAVSKASAQ